MSKMTCGIGYATKLQISDVEDWLDENCEGDWDIGLADLDTGAYGVKKKIEVYFELPADRDKFKSLFKQYEANRAKEAEVRAEREMDRGSGGGSTKKAGGSLGMMRPDRER